eukprot:c29219_g1_i1 orf=268-1404(-)
MSAMGFEGFEKRLEVEFFVPSSLVDCEGKGLRSLSRIQLDEMLSAAECTIVSQLCNEQLDSYVLSESSLFVYPYKIILKTCGTTKLLKAIPVLLVLAAELGLKVCSCKYTRGAYLFPQEQQSPQGSFSREVSYLNQYFGQLGSGSKAYILAGLSKEHSWHIYAASELSDGTVCEPVFTLEMCMTKLDRERASNFYKGICGTAKDMTDSSGIANLLPQSHICDYAFEPCGYSMNGIEENALSTIHVTPEDGFSYASFEAMGYSSKNVDLSTLVNDVLECFKPAVFSVALHASGGLKRVVGSWELPLYAKGYVCDGSVKERLPGGSLVLFHTFRACSGRCPQVIPLPLMDWRQVSVLQDAEDEEVACLVKQPMATKSVFS